MKLLISEAKMSIIRDTVEDIKIKFTIMIIVFIGMVLSVLLF